MAKLFQKFGPIVLLLILVTFFSLSNITVFGVPVTMDESTIIDKIKGGWLGETAGVCWGASTEFGWEGSRIPDGSVPTWSSGMINNGFGQDDIYVEIPFMDAMKNQGVNCSWVTLGDYFRNTSFQLWHANLVGRNNLQRGIAAPNSGHYTNNTCCDDIDWAIEANFVGLASPGMVNSAIEIAWRNGHVMNYGDGVYGGVFVAAMHAKAFTATTLNEIITAGQLSVPLGSKFRQVIDDVIGWKNAGNTWQQNWQLLQNKWGHDDRCQNGGVGSEFNIDAKLNEAYVLMGLLYGNGDLEQSMKIAMQCGQDSDCNPSSAGCIIGTWIGYNNIPAKWKSSLNTSTKYSYTNYTFNDAVNVNLGLAKQVLELSGGSINGTTWTIPDQGSPVPPILEQWPNSSNAQPVLTASAGAPGGRTVSFTASATDGDGIKAYQWFFGDLSYANGANVNHTYAQDGVYQAICYVTDNIGNTSWKAVAVTIGNVPVNVAGQGTIIATVTNPTGGGNKDPNVIRDGVKPAVGSSDSSAQYDTYTGNTSVHDEYIGYTFSGNQTFTKLVFQEGIHFGDGGWFSNGSLKVQVRQSGNWVDVAVNSSPAYPNGDTQSAFGSSYETYTYTLNNVTGDGIRIYGSAGGSAHFISVGELEAWTGGSSGPTPTPGPTVTPTPTPGAGLLTGSAANPGTGNTNLNSQGTIDWAHWGLTGATSFNHKSGVTQQISNAIKIGSGALNRYTNNPNSYTWTGGTPTAAATNTYTGIWTPAINNGFQITVPASTTQRTVKVYVGVWKARGTFTATLSDSSAPAYTSTIDNSTGTTNQVYMITFKAASAGQTLTLKIINSNAYDANGNVTLQAATLY